MVIRFSDEDYMGISLLHTNALVVTLIMANHNIHRILVDNGCSANILYWFEFKKTGLGEEEDCPDRLPLDGIHKGTSTTDQIDQTARHNWIIPEAGNNDDAFPVG